MILSNVLDQWLVAARKYVLALGVILLACITPLFAQEGQQLTPPKFEGKVIFGSALFGEDLEHILVGVAGVGVLHNKAEFSATTS